ncbi:hypothetical protein BGZ46_008579 [Entomortierella lignicola]|nr:hypothetical protein BGZ46_008579 [Entomortierella lignicola]
MNTALIFIGLTGAGKSTLLSLIGGNFESGVAFRKKTKTTIDQRKVWIRGNEVLMVDVSGAFDFSFEGVADRDIRVHLSSLEDILRRGYQNKIYFVLKATNRGPSDAELEMMANIKKSVQGIDTIKVDYRVIVNQILDQKVFNMYQSNIANDNLQSFFRNLRVKDFTFRDLQIDHVYLLRYSKEDILQKQMHEMIAEDVYIPWGARMINYANAAHEKLTLEQLGFTFYINIDKIILLWFNIESVQKQQFREIMSDEIEQNQAFNLQINQGVYRFKHNLDLFQRAIKALIAMADIWVYSEEKTSAIALVRRITIRKRDFESDIGFRKTPATFDERKFWVRGDRVLIVDISGTFDFKNRETREHIYSLERFTNTKNTKSSSNMTIAVLFFGNAGAGKSTLLSQLGGNFESGVKFRGGFTKDIYETRVNIGGHDVVLMDVPGLFEPDDTETKFNAGKLTEALKRGYDYKLYFVMQASNRGPDDAEMMMMSRINECIKQADSKASFRLIVNQIHDQDIYNMYMDNIAMDNCEGFFNSLNIDGYSFDIKIDNVLLIRFDEEALESKRLYDTLANDVKAHYSSPIQLLKNIFASNEELRKFSVSLGEVFSSVWKFISDLFTGKK